MDLEIKKFSELDLSDHFFDSLKVHYSDFEKWFAKKSAEGAEAYVFFNEEGKITDFLYLKIETEELKDIEPILPSKRRLKVGTFKLLSRGTRRGERFMKKIMDKAIAESVDEIYVTMFQTEELESLIRLFKCFGFEHKADKPHENGESEIVLLKDMHHFVGDIEKDYPFVKNFYTRKYLLSIYPSYHTKLFPDSILNNESYDLIQDIKPTNSIYKIYICRMKDVNMLRRGDNVVVYRTTDNQGPAYYRSVATSICTVIEIKQYFDFKNIDDFLKYTQYSVFEENELRNWYDKWKNLIVIKMLYNVAFTKRVIRKDLIEKAGIPEDAYWGFCELNDEQYMKIIELGEADERYFIN